MTVSTRPAAMPVGATSEAINKWARYFRVTPSAPPRLVPDLLQAAAYIKLLEAQVYGEHVAEGSSQP